MRNEEDSGRGRGVGVEGGDSVSLCSYGSYLYTCRLPMTRAVSRVEQALILCVYVCLCCGGVERGRDLGRISEGVTRMSVVLALQGWTRLWRGLVL